MLSKLLGLIKPSNPFFLTQIKNAYLKYLESPDYSPLHKLCGSLIVGTLIALAVITALSLVNAGLLGSLVP